MTRPAAQALGELEGFEDRLADPVGLVLPRRVREDDGDLTRNGQSVRAHRDLQLVAVGGLDAAQAHAQPSDIPEDVVQAGQGLASAAKIAVDHIRHRSTAVRPPAPAQGSPQGTNRPA
jgi:hypothetical protein